MATAESQTEMDFGEVQHFGKALRREEDAFTLLIKVSDESPPETDTEELFRKFASACSPYHREIVRHYFNEKLWRVRKLPKKKIVEPEIEARAAEIETRAAGGICIGEDGRFRHLGRVHYFSTVTLEGCARIGKWYTRLSKQGRPDQRVHILTEERESEDDH